MTSQASKNLTEMSVGAANAVSQTKSEEVAPYFLSDALLQAIGNTEICVFIYYPQEHRIEVPKNTCDKYQCKAEYEDMPRSFADDFVHDDDREVFFELYRKIDEGIGSASATFHSKDMSACCHVTLTELKANTAGFPQVMGVVEEGTPRVREVVGVIEDISELDRGNRFIREVQESLAEAELDGIEAAKLNTMVGSAISEQYASLYCIDMETEDYVCYVERIPNVAALLGKRGKYTEAFETYLEHFIDFEDRPLFREYANAATIAECLRDKGTVSFEYFRKDIGWSRGKFIVAKRNENGEASYVVFAVVDINDEKSMDIARNKAIFEAQHDQLTSAYNRKAFDDALAANLFADEPVGFAIMDIDHFKEINDQFGHDSGDKVLATVSQCLSSEFREGDRLYRIGGDEFVMLLPKATEASWKALCRKFARVHTDLKDSLSMDANITLSVGLCFSQLGLHDWMYRIADEGLFVTKRNGRAGCTMVDGEGNVLDTWKDEDAAESALALLAGSNAAITRIERAVDGSGKPRFIAGDAARAMYGMPVDATPEECFELWRQGIVPMYREVVDAAGKKMLESENVECTYLWAHHGKDPFYVRMVGAGLVEGDTAVVYCLHRSLEGATVFESDDDKRIIQAQSAACEAMMYVDLSRNVYEIMKASPEAYDNREYVKDAKEGAKRMVNVTVHPDYYDKMFEFMDLSTLAQRLQGERQIDCEYLSLTNRGWCRASWKPVRWNAAGDLTHALLTIVTIDAAKQFEMEKDRQAARLMALHYQAAETLLSSKILAIALIEKATSKGKMWTGATSFSMAEEADMSDLALRDAQRMPEGKRQEFIEAMRPDDVVGRVAADGRYQVPAEMRLLDGSPRFVEYHFSEYEQDPNFMLAVVEDVTSIYEMQGRSVEDLFNSAPAGLATFEWNGEHLKALHVSRYCDELFGDDVSQQTGLMSGPDYLRIHPDDKEEYYQASLQALRKLEELHHSHRVWNPKKGRYIWIRIDAAVEDMRDGHVLVYALYTDITARKEAEPHLEESYKEHLQSLVHASAGTKSIVVSDLMQDTSVLFVDAMGNVLSDGQEVNYQKALLDGCESVCGDDEKAQFRELFSAENLIAAAKAGKSHVGMECMMTSAQGKTEWCDVTADIVTNPINGHIEVVGKSFSVNSLRLAELLVKKGMGMDYSMVSVLIDRGKQYYLYDRFMNASCVHGTDFWTACEKMFTFLCTKEECKRVLGLLDRKAILDAVFRGESPQIPILITYGGKSIRYAFRFVLLDEKKGLVVAALKDMTDAEMDAKFRHSGRHDGLTDLYNRQAYFEACRLLLEQHPQEEFAMLKLNVRRFRLYNEAFGEKAGDKFLITIADGIRSLAKNYNVVAYGRIEGDVFSAFYPTTYEDMTKQHIGLIGKLFNEYSEDFLLEPAVGVYKIVDRNMPIESMFARATVASRSSFGKAGYIGYFTQEMENQFEDEMFIANEMRPALEKRQFKVYLQPKFNMSTGQCAGAEALVRWVHPQRGVVLPSRFVPVFESNGFVTSFDRYMWESVCVILRRWLDEGRNVMPVSVNMSRVSAYSKATVPFLKDLVTRYDIPPSLLQLELTESAYIEDPIDIKRSFEELQRFGFTILMDDFGSGYSSLNTLRELPVDVIKLDMRFLHDAIDDPRGRTVVSSTVEMSRRLGLPVVAEGVETEEQAEFLKSIGCRYVQGYLYARPMSVEQYEAGYQS